MILSYSHIYCHIHLEPVDGAAVDERGKHSKSVAEGISDGTHGQHHVEMFLHSLNKEVVHGERRGLYLPTLHAEKD